MRRTLTGTILILSATTACAPKAADEGAQSSSADSAAAIRLIDSLEAANPAVAAPSVDSAVKGSAATKPQTKAPPAGKIIGRDSAFGPTYTVDSTGKVVPIVPAKKKP